MGWPRPPRSSAPWLYSAAETGLEEEEGPEGLRKRGDGRREMWGHQQHVGRGGMLLCSRYFGGAQIREGEKEGKREGGR